MSRPMYKVSVCCSCTLCRANGYAFPIRLGSSGPEISKIGEEPARLTELELPVALTNLADWVRRGGRFSSINVEVV